MIPEDWDLVAAEEICEVVVDCKNRTPPFVDSSDFAVVRTPNVRNGRFVYEDLRFTDEQSFHEWTARAVPQQGDILITREAPLGEVCLVPNGMKVCLGQRMMLYRPDPNKTSSTFFLYALMAPEVQKCLFKQIGGSTVGHAKVNDIKALEVPLPPLSEQRAIAATLSDVDALIAALDKLITKQRHLKTATMQQLLTGKKRLPGFGEGKGYKQTEVGVIPEDWEVDNIASQSSITTGGQNTQDRVEDGQYPFFVRSQTVERINSYSFDGEAVLTAGDGVGTGKVFHYINGKFDVHQRVYRISDFKPALDGFFFYTYFSNRFYGRIASMTAKSSVDSVRMEMIADMLIPLPSAEEQRAIATVLSDMDGAISALETRRAKTQAIKQGMMQELLTGRTRLV
ncbi:MAG: restriction endonuclease subunit S [Nodosilinea sp.]